MLDIRGLKKSFDGKTVLDGLDLTVREGDLFGFIGRNGAGKSTTLKSILGFLFPDAGEIRFQGEPVTRPAFRDAVGYLPEIAVFPANLTAWEFMVYAYSFYGPLNRAARARLDGLLAEVGLGEARNARIGGFSKGMKQRLGIAQALAHDPALLILDEPFTGLDPIGKRQLKNILAAQNRLGKTILFSSHNLTEVQHLCSVIGVMHGGRADYQGSLADFLRQRGATDLEEAFLRYYAPPGGPS